MLTTIPILRALRELLEALDRRVPQIQRIGESAIAREAAALRLQTMKRIAELHVEPCEAEPAREPGFSTLS